VGANDIEDYIFSYLKIVFFVATELKRGKKEELGESEGKVYMYIKVK
jgi:hypothetical protein